MVTQQPVQQPAQQPYQSLNQEDLSGLWDKLHAQMSKPTPQYKQVQHPILRALALGIPSALLGAALGGGGGAALLGAAGAGNSLAGTANYNQQARTANAALQEKQQEMMLKYPEAFKAIGEAQGGLSRGGQIPGFQGAATTQDVENYDSGQNASDIINHQMAVAKWFQDYSRLKSLPGATDAKIIEAIGAAPPQAGPLNTPSIPAAVLQQMLSSQQSGIASSQGHGIESAKAPATIEQTIAQGNQQQQTAAKTRQETLNLPANDASKRNLEKAQAQYQGAQATQEPYKAQTGRITANASAVSADAAMKKAIAGKTPGSTSTQSKNALAAKSLQLQANGFLRQPTKGSKILQFSPRPSDTVQGALWDKLTGEYSDLANQAAGTATTAPASGSISGATAGSVTKTYGNGKFKASY